MIDQNELERLSKAATKLWSLLDDIDTLDDACKSNDEIFRQLVRKVQRKRFDVMSGEEWEALRTGQLVPVQQPSGDVVEAVARANLECLEMSEKLQDAEDEIRLLTKALHDAINAPKGVVPASAEAFYDPAAIAAYEALRAKDTRP